LRVDPLFFLTRIGGSLKMTPTAGTVLGLRKGGNTLTGVNPAGSRAKEASRVGLENLVENQDKFLDEDLYLFSTTKGVIKGILTQWKKKKTLF
jgi:hypothetical protein